jgi:hypothetical protein
MRRLACALALAFTFPMLLAGQGPGGSVHGEFYGFTAPIVSNTQYYSNPNADPACFVFHPPGEPFPSNCTTTAVGGNNTGFGLDLLGRAGVGGEIEVGYANSNWSFSGNDSAIGIGSIDLTDHFFGAKRNRRLDPFAAGGYSLYFGERTTFRNGFNLGVGANYWLRKHFALRSEIRFQGGIDTLGGYSQFTHFVAFRFGIALR